MLDVMEERLCVGCGDPSAKFVEDWHEGTTICTNCGTVDPIRLIDPTLEKRKFSDSDGADPERTEEVDRFIGIQTNFAFAKNEYGEFDANLSGLSSALRKQRKLSYKETKIQSGLSDINSMCTRLALPKRVQARARDLFAIWEENRPKFSRSGEMAIVLAIIFKACKIENNTRSFKELSAATGVPANSISKFYKRLEKTLNSGSKIQIHTSKTKPFSTASDEVIDQVTRITGKMGLPYAFTVQTIELARSAANLLEGKHPNSIAAACIYHNAQLQKLPLSEKDLTAHAGLAVATMKGAWKTLQESLAAAPLVSITTGQVVLANLASPVEEGDDEDVSLSDRPSPDLER